MNILLIGERYSQNLGDAVICETVHNIIKDNWGSSINITDFDISGKTDYNEYYQYKTTGAIKLINFIEYRLPIILKWHPLFSSYQKDQIRYQRSLSLLNSMFASKKFDLIVFAGGAMFMDYFAGLIYCIVRKASVLKVPIIFHACGISSLSDDSARMLVKALSSKYVKSISIRDSKKRFQDILSKKISVQETNDTALCCNNYFMPNTTKFADFGIGLIGLPQYKENQKELIDFFLKSDYSWKIFTNGAPYDQAFAEEILEELGINRSHISKYLCERPKTSNELIHIITGFRKILSFRLHSQIVASSYGIPCYGFIWDEKIKDYYSRIGLPERCLYPSDIFKKTSDLLLDEDSTNYYSKLILLGDESKANLLNQIKYACDGGKYDT